MSDTPHDTRDDAQDDSWDFTDLLSPAEVAQIKPGGFSVSSFSVFSRKGKLVGGRRIRLRVVRTGGRVYTTTRWLKSFYDAVTEAEQAALTQRDEAQASGLKINTGASDRRRDESFAAADEELRAAGL